MVASIVSIRMPSSLVQRLRELAKDNHFLDVSEEIRSIIKVKAHTYKVSFGDSKLLAEEPAKKPADFKTKNLVREELVKRLKKMIEELEHE